MKKKGKISRFDERSAGNLLKKMKLLIAFFFIGLLGASASSYSQATKLSLKLDRVTVKEAFKQIERTSEFVFFYNEDYVDVNRMVSLNAIDENVESILGEILNGTKNTFKIYDRQIVILPPESKGSSTPISVEASAQEPQKKELSGIVKDGNGLPIPGVSVVIKGTTIGTITDVNGQFKLPVQTNAKTIAFSFVGMETKEFAIGAKTSFAVVLSEQINSLDEVVAVGYGTIKRKDLTGSVGQVTSDQIMKTEVTGLDQALQGKIAGVQVTNNSGEPGGSVSIRIRGVGSINSTNEPLFIIDGIPNVNINSINPTDIDRIDVLKDAAATSIYGAKATNGVILVTTKQAKKGLVVSFDGYAGVQSMTKFLPQLNSSQFAQLANENLANGGMATNPAWTNYTGNINTNWQKEVTQVAPIQNYSLNISNGTERSATMLSISYRDQKGVLLASEYQRYTVRLNTTYNLSEKLKAGLTLNGGFTNKQSVISQSDYNGILNNALQLQPTSPVRTNQTGFFDMTSNGTPDPSGKTFFNQGGYALLTTYSNINWYPSGINNAVYETKIYTNSPGKNQSILASAFAEYEVIKGLRIKSTLNLTFGNDFYTNSTLPSPSYLVIGTLRTLPTYNENWDRSNQWNWINTISFDKTIGNHHISAIAGIDAQKYYTTFSNISTSNDPPGIYSISASDPNTRVAAGYPSISALLSQFGRANYDFAGKYLVSATIRRDGSSSFAPAKQYGLFGSGSVAWRISQENFMKNIEFINDLKIRGSYGTVGNASIPPFKYLSSYSNDAGTYFYTLGTNKTSVPATYQSNTGDPNIHWEKSIQTDIGFDLSVLKGKLFLTADYYNKQISDMLGNFPVPAYTGVFGSSVLQNGFSMDNKGLEFALGYHEKFGLVNFSASANFATLQNKITKLTNNNTTYVAQDIHTDNHNLGAITETLLGGRIGEFYGYLTNGIAQTAAEASSDPTGGISAGDRKYKDVNKDGIVNSSDRVPLGNGLPKYNFGGNVSASYKSFDLSVFLNGQAGVQIANMMTGTFYDMRFNNSTGIVNVSSDLMHRWTGPGTSNTMSRNAYNAPVSNDWFSNHYIQNGSYLKITNLQIGYTFNESLLKVLGISHLRFYVEGQNLYTFTKYKGWDPEIGSPNQNVLQTGADLGRYPLARTVSIGVNCKF